MADDKRVEFIISGDASGAIAASQEVINAYKNIGTSSLAEIEKMKAKIVAAYDTIKATAGISAKEIEHAEAAKNRALVDLNQKFLGDQLSFVEQIKQNWLQITAAIGAFSVVIDFLKSSAEKAFEAEKAYNHLRIQIENLGLSYEALGPQIDSALNRASGYALVEGEDAAKTLKELIFFTGDYQKSIQNLNLVYDLAYQKGISASEAATLVGKAMVGNVEMLGRYIPELRNLNDKLGEFATAEEKAAYAMQVLADKSAGSLEKMTEHEKQVKRTTLAWEEFKEQTGHILLEEADVFSRSALGLRQMVEDKGFWGGYAQWATTGKKDMEEYLNNVLKARDAQKKAAADQAEADQKQKQTAKDLQDAIKAQSDARKAQFVQNVALAEQEIKTLKSNIDYELALEEQKYKDKTISIEEYIANSKALNDEYTQALIESKKKQIEALVALGEFDPAKADPVKVKAVEEEILQIRADSAKQQVALEQKRTDETKKIEEDALRNFQALQQLKLQSLKGDMDLANAMDEAAAQEGALNQADLLSRKVARLNDYYEQQISMAIETAEKIKQTEGDTDAYKKALEDKLRLQNEYEVSKIQSETAIRESEKKELLAAQQFYSQTVGDRVKLAELERNEKMKELVKYYNQGLIAEREFQEAKAAIVEESEKKISEIQRQAAVSWQLSLGETAEAYVDAYWLGYNLAKSLGVNFIYNAQLINDKIKETFSATINAVKEVTEGVEGQFDAIKKSGIETLQKANDEIKKIQNLVNQDFRSIANLYDYMKELGKGAAASVGMTAEEWVRKLADYIAYVKGLMQELKDVISSYQDQLDSLRGNDMAILDRWYAAEIQKLKDKYGEELQNTKEYHDAMLLLQELYNEKKKRLQEEAENDANSGTSGATSGAGGSAGAAAAGGSGLPSWMKNFVPDMSNLVPSLSVASGGSSVSVVQKSELKADFTITSYDPEAGRRYTRDVIWPEIKRLQTMEGA